MPFDAQATTPTGIAISDLDAFNDLAAINAKRMIDANPRLIFSLSNLALEDLKAKAMRVGFMSGRALDYRLVERVIEELERRGSARTNRSIPEPREVARSTSDNVTGGAA